MGLNFLSGEIQIYLCSFFSLKQVTLAFYNHDNACLRVEEHTRHSCATIYNAALEAGGTIKHKCCFFFLPRQYDTVVVY